ncbi:MAG: ABC transporter ATP-binding protein [Verrucomicrobiota bacterium]
MPSAEPIIQARGVAKKYGDFQALIDFDLLVNAGECVGLLGPNGAGKSTFIGCLYQAVRRSAGELKVFGYDPAKKARLIKEKIGVVPQENALDEGLSVFENMRIYARFVGLSSKKADHRINELLEHMSLETKRNDMIRSLSGGMKRRLTFVRALLADPELLLLDEPTTGLDPSVRHLLWDKVSQFRKQGKTILVTTHYMHEAEVLCDRIVILNKGTAIAVGAPQELIRKETPGYVGIFPESEESKLKPFLKNNWELYLQGHHCCIRASSFDELVHLQEKTSVAALQMRPANLEDVYLKLTGRELEG